MSQLTERWDEARVRIREEAIRRTPKVLTNYPFEVLVAALGILMGLPFLLGVAAPASLLALVGTVAFYAWSAALVIGGLTVGVGLRVGDRPNALFTAAGLQLAGGCFGVYALAAIIVLGLPSLTAVAAYVSLCALSLIRATHFRRVVDIQRGARRLKEGGR